MGTTEWSFINCGTHLVLKPWLPGVSGNSRGGTRRKHLLSGLIRCGACGGNFVINGKDYYRCGRLREGGCHSDVSIRKAAIEAVAFSVILERLLTAELAELFAAELAVN